MELCGDMVMGSAAFSIGLINSICTQLLNLTPTSFPLFPTTSSYVHAYHDPLGHITAYNHSFDPYYEYLQDMPRKIIWSLFIDHAFDFSMAFDEFKRPLTLFALFFPVFFYSHYSKMYDRTYDKLLRALTASKSRTQLLSTTKEWLMLLEPLISLS